MTDVQYTARRQRLLLTALAILGWFTAVAVGGYNGFFLGLAPLAVPALVVVTIVVPVTLYFAIPGLRAAVSSLGLRAITAFHVWRIAAALLFFWYGAEGLLPAIFVANAGWGDLLAGLLAGLVLLLPFRRSLYAAVHVFGFADFILAVGTGMVLLLSGVPAMANIGGFPVVLIPLFGVGLSAATHIVAFDLLLRGEAAPEPLRTAVRKG